MARFGDKGKATYMFTGGWISALLWTLVVGGVIPWKVDSFWDWVLYLGLLIFVVWPVGFALTFNAMKRKGEKEQLVEEGIKARQRVRGC